VKKNRFAVPLPRGAGRGLDEKNAMKLRHRDVTMMSREFDTEPPREVNPKQTPNGETCRASLKFQ
jgi:hypothetical protein